MGFLGIGNNPMVGCTVACAVDVAEVYFFVVIPKPLSGTMVHIWRIWVVCPLIGIITTTVERANHRYRA